MNSPNNTATNRIMVQEEYEQIRHDCWIRFKTETLFTIDEAAFCAAFDRAYFLGQQDAKQAPTADVVVRSWVARDENGDLYVYRNEPYRSGDCWFSHGDCSAIDSTRFRDVTWESEPLAVNISITPRKR